MPPEENASVTPILGVLIGVVASLIIIAIGVVACMRNNRCVPRRVSSPGFLWPRTESDFTTSPSCCPAKSDPIAIRALAG